MAYARWPPVAPPAHAVSRDQDARRVQATILTIVPVAGLLAAIEAVLAARTGNVGLWILCVGTFGFCALLVPGLGMLRRGHVGRAVLLACASIVFVQLLYLVVYPRVYPAIAIASWVTVGLALPFLRGRRLLALLLVSWGVSALAIVVGVLGPDLLGIPDAADIPVQLGAGLAAVTVGMVLLWTFTRSMTAALEEARRSNEQLTAAHQQLREQENAKSAFINQAAHELNTPLTPVLLQLHLLRLSHKVSDPSQERMLSVLERNVERMKALIHEMLDVARLQAGRLKLKPAEVDLAAVLQATLDDFALVAKARGVDLALTVPGTITVRTDRQRVEQVVSNLLSNAVRLTPGGGSVRVDAQVDGAQAVVRVRDTGLGLAPDQIGMLFQPFTRVHDEVQQGAGTGLGLYISQGIAKELGGRIWAESDGPGKGSTFTLALPVPAATPSPA